MPKKSRKDRRGGKAQSLRATRNEAAHTIAPANPLPHQTREPQDETIPVAQVPPRRVKSGMRTGFLIAWKTVTAFSAVVSALGVIFLRPQLKVSDSGPIDASAPASLTFTLSNDSAYALRDIEYECTFPMIAAQDGTVHYTNTGAPDTIKALDTGESQKVDCRNGIVTRVTKFWGEPMAELKDGPLMNTGAYEYSVGSSHYSIHLSAKENTMRGLCAVLNQQNPNASVGYGGLETYLPKAGMWTGIYQMAVLTPDPSLAISLSDDSPALISPNSRRVVDLPIEEIRTALSISYRPWFLPFRLRQERYFASTRLLDGRYRFGPISKSEMAVRTKATDTRFSLTSPEK